MPRLPRPTGLEMVRYLERQGFAVVRIRGAHHIVTRAEQRTNVPVHGHRVLKIGTLRSILREIGMSPEGIRETLAGIERPVVVTVDGKPAFELIPIRPDDGACWQKASRFAS